MRTARALQREAIAVPWPDGWSHARGWPRRWGRAADVHDDEPDTTMGVTDEFLRSAAERARDARARTVDAVIAAQRAVRQTELRQEGEALREAARQLHDGRDGREDR